MKAENKQAQIGYENGKKFRHEINKCNSYEDVIAVVDRTKIPDGMSREYLITMGMTTVKHKSIGY